MSDIYLLRLALDKSSYLTQRQSLIAENVANADTPGYRARDLPAFSAVLGAAERSFSGAANGGSIQAASFEADPVELRSSAIGETISGNSVSVERQMSALAEVNRAYALTTSITKAYNRMFASVAK